MFSSKEFFNCYYPALFDKTVLCFVWSRFQKFWIFTLVADMLFQKLF